MRRVDRYEEYKAKQLICDECSWKNTHTRGIIVHCLSVQCTNLPTLYSILVVIVDKGILLILICKINRQSVFSINAKCI